MDPDFLQGKKVAELREIGRALKIPGAEQMKKTELKQLLISMHEEALKKEEAQKPAEQAEASKNESAAAEAPAEEPAPPEKPKKQRRTSEKKTGEKSAPAGKQAKKAKEKDAASAEKKEEAPAEKTITVIEKTGIEEPRSSAPAQEEAAKPQAAPEKQEKQPEKKKQIVLKDGRFETKGILEIVEQGYGFLRFDNYLTSDQDIFVNQVQIKRFNLKTGDMIECIARPAQEGDRFGALLYVKTVNGDEPGKAIRRTDFADLTPIYPTERIVLENGSSALSMRMTDIIAPIGKGQRGLIVAPPKAGKTTLLKQIAQSIEKQGVDAELIVLLIDERPEEVTDMKRSINGEVIYSTFDEQPSNHVKVAEMVLARAMRLAEHGKDVIILLDSITRLARAYNLVEPPSGRTLSGGLDPAALYKPKKFFGAARNTEEGGSITILATALIETGSRMDDMIFEEFKGTGNMELHLDRKLSEKRIFPAINLNKSGTRREDMLMSPDELEAVWMMRRVVADMGIQDATEKIVFDMVHTRKNVDFVERMRKMRL